MPSLAPLPGPSLALWADLHQLTAAFGYFKTGAARQDASFSLTFPRRLAPDGFLVACGLEQALQYLESLRFALDDLDYLATLTGNDEQPLFDDQFLEYLRRFTFRCDVHAVPEGTVVFPGEPLLRVTGPLLEAQLVATALTTLLGFQTLIATKAARLCAAAAGAPVIELGWQGAQGIDGGLAASRAAHIGGCAATSNLLAGRHLGIPVHGGPPPDWVAAFEDETEAFVAYAAALPAHCLFPVDTQTPLASVRRACEVGRALRDHGHRLVGIHLDSGALAELSVEARRILDAAGFPDAKIVAGEALDEHRIAELKRQGAAITGWAVGLPRVTDREQPYPGAVYGLTALREPGGRWEPRVGSSPQNAKPSPPGLLQVRRYFDAHGAVADALYDELVPLGAAPTLIDPLAPQRRLPLRAGLASKDLLIPILRGGERRYEPPPLLAIREHARTELQRFSTMTGREADSPAYPVGLERSLFALASHLTSGAPPADPVARDPASRVAGSRDTD